jgi:L-lysine exporter family protein LysE/ArgO
MWHDFGVVLFFFSLGFGAKRMGWWLGRPNAWRILDGSIGGLLLLIAFQLVQPLLPLF